ncbi:hypothetical protein HO133_004077 [Letharia lupina]|uniref:Uncharacterized protein n=1 Tax=Letharia lupina TaxID=560253 RepID=A0A8H6CA88_9LECA|nr:uncharacterized protein HO133_004077 [Letharia lupina]KAF6219608.1 hypothetical protein HO133_004077 [Letharia lupina]
MAVTKLLRTRKGILSHGPPLSWPNDTTIGPRRPRLGLLRQATHNHRQHRISDLSASSRHKAPKLIHHPHLRSRAPQASSYSRYKAHKRTHHSTQQSKAPKVSGKPPKQIEKLVVQKPPPHATQLPKASQVSSSSLINKKKDAMSQKNNHTGKPSHPPPLTSEPPRPDTHPAAKGMDWTAYDRAKAHRLKNIRIWVHSLRRAHRIVDSVATELMAYYGSAKYGGHPSARTLSRHAWQAVRLCEHEFGTDLQWGKGLGEAVWGTDHGKVEALIEMKMEGEGTPGVGTVGESDLSEFEDGWCEEEEEEDDDEGFWGDGEGKDVEMAEAP